MVALFNTGSDINVIQQSAFKRFPFGTMIKCDFQFDAVGSQNQTLGYFNVKIEIDGEIFNDICFVIRDQSGLPELIIGLSIINQSEMTINASGITIKKVQENSSDDDDNQINQIDSNEWNLQPMCALIADTRVCVPEIGHIVDKDVQKEVEILVTQYEPKKTKESPIEMKIILDDETLIFQRARRFPLKTKEEAKRQINKWLKDGIIQPSSSDFAPPICPVLKKDSSTRICVDYRAINRKIFKDRFPMPVIDDQIDSLKGAQVFSTLDLANGFFHIPVATEGQKYTVFVTAYGHYEFLRAPFGLCNSPGVSTRLINCVCRIDCKRYSGSVHGRRYHSSKRRKRCAGKIEKSFKGERIWFAHQMVEMQTIATLNQIFGLRN